MLIVCGLNHQTAPLSIRETVAVPIGQQDEMLARFMTSTNIQEAAFLSTCNRTEWYCETNNPEGILSWFAQVHQLQEEVIEPHLYFYSEDRAVHHALRVATGLDSMMLGEPQILGQLKQTYQKALKLGTIKRQLRPLFQYLFNASKRIRTKSGIGKHPISIAFAAVQLINQSFVQQNSLTILIIGSGETAALVGRYLHEQNRHKFIVASRTEEHAEILATAVNGAAIPINALAVHLPSADVVISATSCPLPFISQSLVAEALIKRNHAPVFFLDLAVPRDIEPNVALLHNVQLYNIDDLQAKALDGMQERQANAVIAEKLIDKEMHLFKQWRRSREAKQLICEYRDQMQTLAKQEVERSLQRLAAGQCQYHVIEELSDRLVSKLTHVPTVGLRQAASEGRTELLDLAQYLFQRNKSHHEAIT